MLLDEFAGEKQLEMDFDYSLKSFKTQLEERNFLFSNQSFTNYPNKIYSIPSLLNMIYADDVIEKYQSDSKDVRASSPLIKHNNVMKIFKSNKPVANYNIRNINYYFDYSMAIRNLTQKYV